MLHVYTVRTCLEELTTNFPKLAACSRIGMHISLGSTNTLNRCSEITVHFNKANAKEQ